MASLWIVNPIIFSATLAGQIVIAIIVISFLVSRATERKNAITRTAGRYGILCAFLVSLGATAGSLYYSDIIGFLPCTFCWYQRIFIYPQVILLGLALWRRERTILPYSIALACIGFVIALYQYLFLLGAAPDPACSATTSISCAVPYVNGFGYISIPLMGLTTFGATLAFLLASSVRNKISNGASRAVRPAPVEK